jgi:hypothetical protein
LPDVHAAASARRTQEAAAAVARRSRQIHGAGFEIRRGVEAPMIDLSRRRSICRLRLDSFWFTVALTQNPSVNPGKEKSDTLLDAAKSERFRVFHEISAKTPIKYAWLKF